MPVEEASSSHAEIETFAWNEFAQNFDVSRHDEVLAENIEMGIEKEEPKLPAKSASRSFERIEKPNKIISDEGSLEKPPPETAKKSKKRKAMLSLEPSHDKENVMNDRIGEKSGTSARKRSALQEIPPKTVTSKVNEVPKAIIVSKAKVSEIRFM